MTTRFRARARLAGATITALAVATTVLFALPANARARSSTPPTEYVDVSAATLWTSPSSPRPVDAPALGNPVHLRQWMAAMTLSDKDDLISDNLTQTQALYGQPVYVLARQGAWDEVAVPGQPTPKNPLGYPGWVPAVQLTSSPGFAALAAHRPFALVNRGTSAWLYNDAGLTSHDLPVSVNTRLPELARIGDAILVDTPANGPKWLFAKVADVYRSNHDIPYPTGADLVRFAKRFLGLPYLWGGRSGFGVDCSGFTSTIYQANGITIPRDADAQAGYGGGHRVHRADLRPGDLLFYAHDNGTGSIYHVAMYIGGGQMIEAYDPATPVRITPARFGTDYWGAERFLRTS